VENVIGEIHITAAEYDNAPSNAAKDLHEYVRLLSSCRNRVNYNLGRE
jgi:hypothetical protein